jgi:hypothetical protein
MSELLPRGMEFDDGLSPLGIRLSGVLLRMPGIVWNLLSKLVAIDRSGCYRMYCLHLDDIR